MSRVKKILTQDLDLGYLLSVGFLALLCPRKVIDRALAKFGKASRRIRLFPAHAVVYFVIALALWRNPPQEEVLRIVCQNLGMMLPNLISGKIPTESGINKARIRLGSDVLEEISKQILKPIAPKGALGAWYQDKRLMAIDGSCFSVTESQENAEYFGYPSSGEGISAFPSLRLLGLVETGSHVVVGAQIGPFNSSEQALTNLLFESNVITPEMLIMCDRNFFGYSLWTKGLKTGADLLWRAKTNINFQITKSLPDGSYLSNIYDSKNRKNCVCQYKLEKLSILFLE
jgi:hypothetical protein